MTLGQFSSLHTHTRYCDGADDIETMCHAAYAKGLAAIGFSSHAPLEKAGFVTSWHMKADDLGAYKDEIYAACGRWEGKLAVYAGLEIDYIKGRRSALDSDITAFNGDYAIGSVHYVLPPHGEPFTIDGPAAEFEMGIADGFAGDGAALMNAYWDALIEMVALGGIDIVGHLDLIKKNNAANRWFNRESPAYMRRVEEAAAAIAAAALVVEVSTGGLNRGYFTETCPSLPVLRLLRQYRVPVMISADAHNAHDLDRYYQTACQTLRDAGYTSHVLFMGKTGQGPHWREQALTVSE